MTSRLAGRLTRKIAVAARGACPRPALLRLALALVVAVGLTAADRSRANLVWGQDDWDAGKRAARQVEEERVRVGGVMAPADFDRWVSGGRSTDQMQRTMESLLTLQVESAARMGGLSEDQKKKLELAGHGDMKRLTRSVDQLKEKFRKVGQDQQKFGEIVREVSQLQTKMHSDVFGESSLYRKILKQTLDRNQSARYEQEERKRRKFRYEARIEAAMSNLETTIPLRAEQRQQLVKLLLAETQPPKRFGQYDYYVVLYQMRQLGEPKVKPIFDDAQWQALKRVLDQAQGLEHHLRQNGILP